MFSTPGGEHQRCWVHFQRDLGDLWEAYAAAPDVVKWVDGVGKLYEEAKSFSSDKASERRRLRFTFLRRLRRLASRYLETDFPQRVLCERIEGHSAELFTFAECPDVPRRITRLSARSVPP